MRLVLLLAGLLLLAGPAQAAIAVVQAVSCEAQGAASCGTPPTTTTTGNLFVASVSFCCAGFTSITDSKANSYTNAIAATFDTVNGYVRQDYVVGGTGGASHTFTMTGAAGSLYASFSVLEISGAATTPLDQTAAGEDLGTTHTSPSTATTAQANELLIGVGGMANLTTYTTNTGAGWTERLNVATDSDSEGIVVGTRIVSATGAYAYTYSTSFNHHSSHGISTWKEATVAAGVRQRCLGCGAEGKVIE